MASGLGFGVWTNPDDGKEVRIDHIVAEDCVTEYGKKGNGWLYNVHTKLGQYTACNRKIFGGLLLNKIASNLWMKLKNI
jgi:hypothetical protein